MRWLRKGKQTHFTTFASESLVYVTVILYGLIYYFHFDNRAFCLIRFTFLSLYIIYDIFFGIKVISISLSSVQSTWVCYLSLDDMNKVYLPWSLTNKRSFHTCLPRCCNRKVKIVPVTMLKMFFNFVGCTMYSDVLEEKELLKTSQKND